MTEHGTERHETGHDITSHGTARHDTAHDMTSHGTARDDTAHDMTSQGTERDDTAQHTTTDRRTPVFYTHLRNYETRRITACSLLLDIYNTPNALDMQTSLIP